jgi:DUF2934 family protein
MKPSATGTGISSTQESSEDRAQLGAADRVTDQEREAIATLAYVLWQNRGCPIGSADEDWIEAEQQLRERKAGAVAGSGR